MEKKRIESYDDGYSRSNAVKRVAAAASALLLCGSLTACRHTGSDPDESVMGNMQYEPPVSGSDASSEDMLTLDGEEQYFPVEGEDAGEEDPESQSGSKNEGTDLTESVIYGQDQD